MSIKSFNFTEVIRNRDNNAARMLRQLAKRITSGDVTLESMTLVETGTEVPRCVLNAHYIENDVSTIAKEMSAEFECPGELKISSDGNRQIFHAADGRVFFRARIVGDELNWQVWEEFL